MADIYNEMISCLNQKIARLSKQEKAAIFALIQRLTGDCSVVDDDLQLNGRMRAWLAQYDIVEGMMWYRLFLNICQGDGNFSPYPGSERLQA